MKRPSGPRKTANLSESLHDQLNMYALAANAAGVSTLASARSAGPKILMYALAASVAGVGALASVPSTEAKIVYTPAHANLPNGYYALNYNLDLNHDGQTDLVFTGNGSCTSNQCSAGLSVFGARVSSAFNEVLTTKHGQRFRENAVALRAGAHVGPVRHFNGTGDIVSWQNVFGKSTRLWYGQWGDGGKGPKDRYVGLKFYIKGKTHYGWARVTVTPTSDNFTAILTGYAYETIPNKPIIAGKTKGSDEIDNNSIDQPNPAALKVPTPDPASLGALAMGAPGLSIWRRKRTSLDGQ